MTPQIPSLMNRLLPVNDPGFSVESPRSSSPVSSRCAPCLRTQVPPRQDAASLLRPSLTSSHILEPEGGGGGGTVQRLMAQRSGTPGETD